MSNTSKTKICIVGTHPDSIQDAPYNDPECSIWGLCGGGISIPRFDLYYELHSLCSFTKAYNENTEYIQFLKDNQKKLVVNEELKVLFPDAFTYPLDDLLKAFPRKFFTSTVAHLLALAIDSKPKEILVYGVHLEENTEYSEQREAVAYYCGIAEGRGIKVTISDKSPILKSSYIYGFDDNYKKRQKAKHKLVEMKRNLDVAKINTIKAAKQESFCDGAIDMLNWIISNQ